MPEQVPRVGESPTPPRYDKPRKEMLERTGEGQRRGSRCNSPERRAGGRRRRDRL
jgi:hypothetical protein